MPSWDHSKDYRDWKLVITGNIYLSVCVCHLAFQTTCTNVVVGMLSANDAPYTGSYLGLHDSDSREDMCVANK